MKHFMRNTGTLIAIATLLASCIDNELPDFNVEKPESIAQLEYLNDYNSLKTYVDRNTNPNFKLGLALAATDYNSQGLIYRLANSNFNEVTPGNEMKYASIVGDDGTMNFATVQTFVETAQAAGTTIYGHTLAWHSQQNTKYLNSLIANKPIVGEPNNVLKIVGDLPKENVWDWEIYYDLDNTLEIGKKYTLSMRIKGTNPGNLSFWPGMKDGSNTHYGFPELSSGKNWINNTIEFTPTMTMDRLRFCFGKLGGTIYFDDVVLTEEGSDENIIVNSSFDGKDISHWTKTSWMALNYEIVTITEGGQSDYWETLITNGDAEGTDISCFFSTEQGIGGPKPVTIGESGTGADGVGHAFIVKSGNDPATTYDTQFFLRSNIILKAGDVCKLSLKYKADKPAGSESQAHGEPGAYIHYDMGVSLNFTTDWQTYEKEFTISEAQAGASGMQTIAWNLAVLKEANTYYFDDIEYSIKRQAEGLPQTPEEKKDTLTWAMGNWIKGMMEATGGYVTAWDAVNEAISGGDNDGDGYYDLQSARFVSEEEAKNNFYWQDYLGSEDYVRIVVAKARQYFQEYGGNPSDLKLFINDYNLESWWDGNQKAKSLVHWIQTWESDGVTKIDGIGTQMHVSYILNDADQKAQEEAIVNMFKILANSGKLIKISELDLGIVHNAFDKEPITVSMVTFEQLQKMAEFYKFIIQKYFEIIPAAQRYGITQWCATDSKDEEGAWRRNEPVGLWDLNYSRKPAYAGFADGLSGGKE